MEEAPAEKKLDLKVVVQDILNTIEREREREIVSRRFGLYDRRETLEQIGELLGITRERVRQLEKAVVTKLRASAEKDLPHIKDVEAVLTGHLKAMGSLSGPSQP
jgi:DNA-directed RNA polymerase sigma subunit (sigma70/sigma32)